MEHKFYNKDKKQQNVAQITIAIFALAIVLASIFVSIKTEIYLIAVFVFSIVFTIVLPFFDVPSRKKSGELIYYSPLFIGEKPKNDIINIHGGTLFDYFYVIDRKMNGNQRTKFIIQNYLEGLLNLIEKLENEKQTNLKIRGTTYIINERTAKKMGFITVKTDSIQKMFLTYTYFNILISNSIAKNKIAFPDLRKIKTFEIDLIKLIESEDYITELYNKLKRK